MSEPHVIRLREPWDCCPQDDTRVLWQRRFGRPTGITPGVTVHLVVAATTPVTEVRMNDAAIHGPIAPQQSASIDVTHALMARNALEVLTSGESASGSTKPSFEVKLEIFAP
jgi:hypothetical protein